MRFARFKSRKECDQNVEKEASSKNFALPADLATH